MARNWTPEERARQAEIIRQNKPWQKSTGPRTERGREASAGNSYKHGFRTPEMAEIRRVLRLQKAYLKALAVDSPP